MDKAVVVLYKKRGRNIAPLRQACGRLKFHLQTVETEAEFRETLRRGGISVIIVNLDANEAGKDNANEFVSTAAQIFEPEDADIHIVYSCEAFTSTPEGWPDRADPRPIRNYERDKLLDFTTEDKDWKSTIRKLEHIGKYFRINHSKGKNSVDFAIAQSTVPFPSEAIFLIRAAFKDMSRIEVDFPKPGLSGSIACYAQPFDKRLNKCNRMFIKIYPKEAQAINELYHTVEFVENYIHADYYPKYHYFRRYHGKVYSVLVTDLTEGPDGSKTFKDLIDDEKYSVAVVGDFIRNTLLIMNYGDLLKRDRGWKCIECTEPKNLYDDYLGYFLSKDDKKEDRKKKLWSENNCHKWFGTLVDLPEINHIEDKICCTFLAPNITGTYTKICHGDLHSENIMVKHEGDRLSPLFIDFSRTWETHSLKDLVTLETDMIIRGLRCIKSFSIAPVVKDFLNKLSFPADETKYEKEWVADSAELTRLMKVLVVLKELRKDAVEFHKVSQKEYECAALLKTLEILSYGKLPHDQNVRATTYVTYLLERLRAVD